MLSIIMNIPDDDDRSFVEKIYDQYEKKLYMLSMQYLQNHHDAQDCVHETIEIVIERIERFRIAKDEGYIENLLMVVCRNCAINALRVRSRNNQYVQPLMRYNYEEGEYEEIEIPDYDSLVDKIYVSEKNCNYLHNLINELDDKYRDVILLKVDGYDTKEIANLMNISEELVRQRYSRAKKQLLKKGGSDLYEE